MLIIGPSGSGKSTLLRCINRLEHLTSGDIWVDEDQVTDRGSDIRRIREEVGMVFQSFNLFPHLTALENITLAPRIVKKDSRDAGASSRAGRSWRGSGSRRRKAPTPTSSPAASSSGSPSPGPWP